VRILALDRRGSAGRNSARILKVIDMHLLIWKISRIINEVAEKTPEFDEPILLDNVQQG